MSVIAFFTVSQQTAFAQTSNNLEIEAAIEKLGSANQDLDQILSTLDKNPHVAAQMLVERLHTLPRRSYWGANKTKESEQVIWSLRALHYLTGLTFSAKTNVKLTDDEKQFLDFNKEMHDENLEHKIHFFGVWMSRDADFVAPLDAQKRIIEQWKQWQRKSGNSFEHTPTNKPSDTKDQWYWYG